MTTRSIALAMAGLLCIANAAARDDDGLPTTYVFTDGTEASVTGVYRHNLNTFSDDEGRFEDSTATRREEFGFKIGKKGVYDISAGYEFTGKSWQDVFVRLQSKALLGHDYGALRLGQSKVPLGFEGNTSSRSTSFLEPAPVTTALYENRRIGIDWAIERANWLANAGYYRQDLEGDNDGNTLAARLVWLTSVRDGNTLHLGISASRERPDGTTDGAGHFTPPSVRFRSAPGVGLTTIRLVDSGLLDDVGDMRRYGLEGLWIAGPWSVQGEYLQASTERSTGSPTFDAEGFYLFGSWVLTGESRPYRSGNVGNIRPVRRGGAVELLLRYDALDLDDGEVRGGRQTGWTFGANWYLSVISNSRRTIS